MGGFGLIGRLGRVVRRRRGDLCGMGREVDDLWKRPLLIPLTLLLAPATKLEVLATRCSSTRYASSLRHLLVRCRHTALVTRWARRVVLHHPWSQRVALRCSYLVALRPWSYIGGAASCGRPIYAGTATIAHLRYTVWGRHTARERHSIGAALCMVGRMSAMQPNPRCHGE